MCKQSGRTAKAKRESLPRGWVWKTSLLVVRCEGHSVEACVFVFGVLGSLFRGQFISEVRDYNSI